MTDTAMLEETQPTPSADPAPEPAPEPSPAQVAGDARGGAAETRMERRADKRYRVRWRGAIRIPVKGENVAYLGQIVDISLSSCSLVLDDNIHPWHRVSVFLELPATLSGEKVTIIEAIGQIVYVSLSSRYGAFVAHVRLSNFKAGSRATLFSRLNSLAM